MSINPHEVDRLQSKVESYSLDNPFRERLLSRLGGLHRPSTAADDRHVMAEEDAVALLRDLPDALRSPVSPF